MIEDSLHKFRCFAWTHDDTVLGLEFMTMYNEYLKERNESKDSKVSSDDILIKLYKQGLLNCIFTLNNDTMTGHLCILQRMVEGNISFNNRQILYDAICNMWRHITDLELAKYRLYTEDIDKVKMIAETAKEYLGWFVINSAYNRCDIRIKAQDLYFPIFLRLTDECELRLLIKYLEQMAVSYFIDEDAMLEYILSVMAQDKSDEELPSKI